MKNNYKRLIPTILLCLLVAFSYAQDIHFTFANAQNTNDGSFDYYEVDVMIQTINTTGTFKLGSGQLYFNYNTAAFGTNVFGNSAFEVTFPEGEYICGQPIDLVGGIGIYGPFTINDNTTSRVSFAFSQVYSSSTFAADNITETPTKLCHLKFTYSNMSEMPMVTYEDGGTFTDQFFTACGPAGGPTTLANCGTDPGTQLFNDTFDSSGATLSNEDFKLLTGLSLYPNPTKDNLFVKGDISQLQRATFYTISGQKALEVDNDFSKINIEELASALYFVKLQTQNASGFFKIVKE